MFNFFFSFRKAEEALFSTPNEICQELIKKANLLNAKADEVISKFAKYIFCSENKLACTQLNLSAIKNCTDIRPSRNAAENWKEANKVKEQIIFDLLEIRGELNGIKNRIPKNSEIPPQASVISTEKLITEFLEYIDFFNQLLQGFFPDESPLNNLLLIPMKSMENIMQIIEKNITRIGKLKNCLLTSRNKNKWDRLIDLFSATIQKCLISDHGWDFMEDLEKNASRPLAPSYINNFSHSYINNEFCLIENAVEINKKEILALYHNLKSLKNEKQQLKAKKLMVGSLVKLKIAELKTRISFLQGNEFAFSGKGSNGAIFVKWKKMDTSFRKVAVFKLSDSLQTFEFSPSKGSPSVTPPMGFGTVVQAFGYYTSTSQKAVVCGAGSRNREACAEKAGFMIADKLHRELIAYVTLKEQQSCNASTSLRKDTFTPMIAGIIDFMNVKRDVISIGSLAVFSEHAIDADAAHEIANVFDKKLDEDELLIFQFFIVFDYLLGNADRHAGNWMLKLSYKNQGAGGLVEHKKHLKTLIAEEALDKESFRIDSIIPIDNGNILPMQSLMGIVDAKQYDWKHLKFADIKFHAHIIDFINTVNLNEAWVYEICAAINEDPHIKKLSSDIGGVFINQRSIEQMILRAKKLKEVGLGGITTPKQLAEAPLAPGWFA